VRRFVLALLLAVPGVAAAQEAAGPEAAGRTGFESAEAAAQEDPRDVVGAPRGTALTGAALDARTEEVGALLRCPVCQGLSIADSPATMATKMKARVRELLAAGYDEEQILSYFERSYGEFVRLEPARRGINWLVWLAPPLALAGGLVLIRRQMTARRTASDAVVGDVPGRAALPLDAELAPYVLRVREIAYGWPGGAPPADPS
jgi:cytochrome c-type biogenesis protein CcmH